MPYLIKQLKKAEACLSRKEARKILKKVDKLNDKPYVDPNDKERDDHPYP